MAKQSGWTYSGSANFSPTAGAGSSSDRTNLKTEVKIISSDRKGRRSKAVSSNGFGTVEYSGVERQDTIEWSVQTLCDNDPISDRVNIVLTYYDPFYIGQLSDQIIQNLSDDELGNILAGDESIIQQKVESSMDIARAIKQIYSTTVITDTSEGKASGTIKIAPDYPFADYVLNFHYGYSSRSERSDSAKSKEFLLETGIMVAEITAVVVATVLSGGTAAIILGTAGAVLGAADLAYAASNYLSSGFGAIDENRQGCLFPILGFNHSYVFTLDEPVILTDSETGETTETSAKTQNIVSQISPASASVIAQASTSGVPTGAALQVVAVGGLVVAALLIALKGGRSQGDEA